MRGKVAVVTGAARGTDRATAVALAYAGADVVGIDICATVDPRSGVTPSTRADLDHTGELVKQASRPWHPVVLDQRNLPAVRSAAAEIESSFGSVEILSASAGIQQFHPLLELEDADWTITIDTNINGTANVLRAFAPAMVKRGRGSVVITTSTQGQHGTFDAAAPPSGVLSA